MKDTEIEIQARIEHGEKLIAFLEKEARFVGEKRQIDEYFVPAHRNFVSVRPVEEWFRLRDEGGTYSMNYKKWHYDENGIGAYADEFETKIDDLEAARKIVQALDCKPLVAVDKTRKRWLYGEYEIALDTVVGLGESVEIEYKGSKERNPKEITDEMIVFLKEHHAGAIRLSNGGYPFELLFPTEAEFIHVD